MFDSLPNAGLGKSAWWQICIVANLHISVLVHVPAGALASVSVDVGLEAAWCYASNRFQAACPFRAAQEPWQAPTAALGWEATRYPALAERAPHISDGAGPGPHLDANHGHVGVHAAAQVGQNSQRPRAYPMRAKCKLCADLCLLVLHAAASGAAQARA